MDPKIKELREKIAKLEREIKKSTKRKDTKKRKSARGEDVSVGKYVPLRIHYTWKSPARIFVPRDRVWFLKIATLALLFILIFAFLQDFLVILVICIFALITFLLASVPPNRVEHQITTKGIKSIGTLYRWKDLRDFWVAEKFGQRIVYVTTKLGFPTRLVMLIKKRDEMTIVKLLLRYLDFKDYEEKQGWISKLSDGETIDPDKYLKAFRRKELKMQ